MYGDGTVGYELLQAHVINKTITKFCTKMLAKNIKSVNVNAFFKPKLQGLYEYAFGIKKIFLV